MSPDPSPADPSSPDPLRAELERLDEAALVARARRERDAFGEVYRRHRGDVARYLARRVGDGHAVDDLVAETFLTALRELPRFRWRGIPLRHWLLRIATHAATRWVRSAPGRAQGAAAIDLAAAPVAPVGELAELATAALAALPPRLQEPLALRYLADLTAAEVAQVLRCSLAAVKSRLARARDALRRELAHRGLR